MAQQPLVGHDLHIVEATLSHSDTSASVGLLWTSDKPDAEACTWQHTTLSQDIRVPGGIPNHNPSKRTTEDPPLDSVATGISSREC